MTKRSKPSSTPKSPSGHARSTTSWKLPEATDVLSYVYLWSHEADQERDEGGKERPVVVVLAATPAEGGTQVYVAPVTTKAPSRGDAAVEVPAAVRAHLGLGDAQCWIVAHEVNRFLWPGPDVRPAHRGGDTSPYYGNIPAKLLERVRAAMRTASGRGPRIMRRSK